MRWAKTTFKTWMAIAVSVLLALAGVVGISAPAQALMTAPSGGSGYTTSTISEPQLAYVSMGSSTQRFAFSNSRSGFIEVGGSAVNDPYITMRSYVDGALDTTFGGTGAVSFLGQLYNYDSTFQYRVELQFATYANGTKWMVLERNATMASGFNYLHLGTYTGGYVSTLTMPTGNSDYAKCQALLAAGTYTTLSYTPELIPDSPFTTPTYLFRCGVYLNTAGTGTSYVDYLTTLAGGTTLGTAGTHTTSDTNRISPLPSVTSPTFIRAGFSRYPGAGASMQALSAFYLQSSGTTSISSQPTPYSTNAWNGNTMIGANPAGTRNVSATSKWTMSQTGTRTGTMYIAPRNSGTTIYAATLASDGTNFDGAVKAIRADGVSATSQPITGAITGTTGWNTQYIVSDSTVSNSTLKLTSYDNSTVRSFEIATATGVATAAGWFNTGGTDWESFRWFPAATSTGVAFYGRTSASTITLVSTSSAPVAPTAPAAPTAVRGNATAAVSWVAPSNGGAPISAYELQYSADSGSTWTSWSTSLTTSPETVTGLTNGTAYTFKVSATNSVGTSAFSAASAAVTPATVPDAPTLGSVTGGNTQIVANWTAPTGTGGSAITDYTIEYSANSGATWTAFAHTASTATSATITGLTNGTSYLVRVSAVNAVGTGLASSNSASTLVATTPSAPAAPTVTRGDTEVTVAWVAPATGGSAITAYELMYSADAGSTWTTWSTTLTSSPETVTGLTNGTSYVFKVAASNVRGQSAFSASSSSISPAALPSAPTLGTVTAGANSIAVSWTAPASTGGFAISDYTIEYSANAGSTWSAFAHSASTATSITITGLTNGTSYLVRIRAVTSVGTGAASANSASQLVAAAPGQPNAPTIVNGSTQVTINWAAPAANGCAITGYQIEISTNGGSSWAIVAANATGTSYAATGLTNGTAYVFRLAATNCMGFGAFSAASTSVTPNPVSSQPLALAVTGSGSNQVALTWTAPSSTGGTSITDYIVEYSTDGGATWQIYADGVSAATSATVTGLTAGLNYSFRVSAVNGVGASSSSTSTLSLASGSVPSAIASAPTGSATPGITTITWTPPADGGSALTSAELQYSTNGGSTWVAYTGAVDLSGSIAVSGLTGGQSYVFRVRALNFFGPSTWSPTTSAIVFQAPTAPAAVTSVTSTAGSAAGTVNLTWTAPAANGSAITDYTIEYSVDGGVTWVTYVHSASTATSATLTGLVPGASYLFRVSAVNGVGSATASSATTPVVATVVSASVDPSKLPLNIKVSGQSNLSVGGGKFTVSGDNLNDVKGVLMNGWEALISARTTTSLTVAIPVQVVGWVDVEFISSFGKIRYDHFVYIDSKAVAQLDRLRLGYQTYLAPSAVGTKGRVSTTNMKLRSIDRLSASTAKFALAKSVTCVAYVGKGMSAAEGMARARNTCELLFARNPKMLVSLAVTKTPLHAHVLALFKY